jgi:hypothetical protein
VLADLQRRELPPVDEIGLRDAGAEVGVADRPRAVGGQAPRELDVQRLGERVAGDEQRPELRQPLGLLAERGGVERLLGDRRRSGGARRGGVWKAPAPPESFSSGDSQAVALWTASASGRRSASQPAGAPTARTTARSTPGSILSPEWRIDWPSSSTSSTTATKTQTIASRARSRRPVGRSRMKGSRPVVVIRTGSR